MALFTSIESDSKYMKGINFFERPAEDYGVDKCPLVLIHGWLGSWKSWTNIIRSLKSPRRIISLSLRGWGDSEKSGTYSAERYTDDIATFLHDLEITNYILCGHSIGALIATILAARFPTRVDGIILCSGVLKMQPQSKVLDGRELSEVCADICSSLQGDDEACMTQSDKDYVNKLHTEIFLPYIATGKLSDTFVRLIVEEAHKASVSACKDILQDVMLRANNFPDLERINAPVLMLWGTADRWVGRNEQDLLREALANCISISFREVDEAPHCLIWTHAEECAELIDDWIDCE